MEKWSEEKIEGWLELETRDLPMPDGSRRMLSAMRVYWAAYDALINEFDFTPEKLVRLAIGEIETCGKDPNEDFKTVFLSGVAFLDTEFQKLRSKYPGVKQSESDRYSPELCERVRKLEEEDPGGVYPRVSSSS